MTKINYEPYMSQFTPEQMAFFNSFPVWVVAAWAIAVWSSVAGSALLLLKSRFAGSAFGISLIAMAVTFVHNYLLSDVTMSDIAGPEALWFSVAIVVTAVMVWLYARHMRRIGVLQ